MSKILNEVRKISSDKIAEKQKLSENGYPRLIEKIKLAAGRGETECEFKNYEIDEYSRRLLEVDGFVVFATSRASDSSKIDYLQRSERSTSIWIVRW